MKHSFTKSFLSVITLLALAFGTLGIHPVSAAPAQDAEAGRAMYIKANPTTETIHVYGRANGTTVTIKIDSPANGVGDDYTASATVVQAPWDPGNANDQVASFNLGHGVFDLQPGDVVKVIVTGSSLTSTVTSLTSLRWFVGLGTGTDPAQIDVEQQVVTDFNKSHATLELMLEVQPFQVAKDTLNNEIATGHAPDIVGPMGWLASNDFHGKWLDLETLTSWAAYDKSIFSPTLLASQHTNDEGQIGLPFLVFPSAMYYNPALFDAAGLHYPPAHYGDQYQMPNLSMVSWNWDTVAEIGKLLTLDNMGRNATDVNFDKAHIVQYGFSFGWQNYPLYYGSYWQSGSLLQTGGTPGNYVATIPTAWDTAWKWRYDGMWGTQPFIPTGPASATPQFNNSNVFASGKVAMLENPSWYMCCMSDLINAGGTFQFGAMPSYNGQVAGRMDGDTFRIPKSSNHPEEAFTVLTYLVDTAASPLTNTYGAMSAVTTKQQEYINQKGVNFPFVTSDSWNILLAGLNYPDVPNADAWVPYQTTAQNRLAVFRDSTENTPDLNMTDEIAQLRTDLEAIFNTVTATVLSIVRASPNPSDANTVTFTVTFSKAVKNVDKTDFSLTVSPGIGGASVATVSGANSTRTVTVNTGTGSGTIRLDVKNSNDIQDIAGEALSGGFATGEVYSINRTLSFSSIATQDGFVLETSENSNTGNLIDALSPFVSVGDSNLNQQYRGIFSFNTASIPDNAIISSVVLKVKKSGVVNGGNPLVMLQGFVAEIKNGFFGSVPSLQKMDFQAAASGTYGPFSPALTGNTYNINLTGGKADINRLSASGGLTQIRLRFNLDDNNNAIANILNLYSGDSANAADRPQLVIVYKLP